MRERVEGSLLKKLEMAKMVISHLLRITELPKMKKEQLQS